MSKTIRRLLLLALIPFLISSCTPGESSSAEGVEVYGELGRQPGRFSKPRAVLATAGGELVVIDRTGRVQIFDLATMDFIRQWRLPAYEDGTPTGISLDPVDDSFWIADTHYHRVLRYNVEGDLLTEFGEHGEDPGEFIFPTDVYPDPDGQTVWVTDYGRRNRVMQFTREGEFVKEWGPELYTNVDLDRPMAIALSEDGEKIYVVDAGNHRINVYNREGELVQHHGKAGTAPGQLKYPYDLSFGPDGLLYIVEYGNNRVSRYTPQWDYKGSWGGAGSRAGLFASPWGCTIGPEGALIVADTNNQRLQIVREPDSYFSAEERKVTAEGGNTSRENSGG